MVEDEVKQGLLHVAKIKGIDLIRKFYICHLKERTQDALIDSTIDYLTRKNDIHHPAI